MSIAVDNTSNGTISNTVLTVAHTCAGTESDGIIIVKVQVTDSTLGDRTISGVTHNNEACTHLPMDSDDTTDGLRVETWYRLNPTTGGNPNIVVTAGGKCTDLSLGAISLTDVSTNFGIMDSYAVGNEDTFYSLYNGAITAISQSFTGDGGSIDNIVFYLDKTGSPTGNAVVKIYEHSGTFGTSSVPTGDALATSDNFDVTVLSGSSELIDFNFPTLYATTNGTKYCAVLEYSGGNSSNYIEVEYDSISSGHSGNQAWYFGSWSANASYDFIFYVNKHVYPVTASGADTAPTLDITTKGSSSYVVDSLASGEPGGSGKVNATDTAIHVTDVGNDLHAAQYVDAGGAGAQTMDYTDADADTRWVLSAVAITIAAAGADTPQGVAGEFVSTGSILKAIGKFPVGALASTGIVTYQSVFSRTITGIFAATGIVNKLIKQLIEGIFTSTGSILRKTGKFPTGAFASSGTISYQSVFGRTITGVSAFTGRVYKATKQAVAGIFAATGSVLKGISKFPVGAFTSSGVLAKVKSIAQAVSGAITFTGSLLKNTGKFVAGAFVSTGILTKVGVFGRTVLGAFVSTGTVVKKIAVSQTVTGILTFTGAALKKIAVSQAVSGIITSTGILTKASVFGRTITGAFVSAGDVVKKITVSQAVAGILTFTGSIGRAVTKTVLGAVTFTGSILKGITKTVIGAFVSAATLVADKGAAGGEAFYQTITGIFSATGTVIKGMSETVTGIFTSSGAIFQKAIGKFPTGSFVSTGTVAMQSVFSRTIIGVFLATGKVKKAIPRIVEGILTLIGELSRFSVFGRTVTGIITYSGRALKNTTKSVAGTIIYTGAVIRIKGMYRTVTGALVLTGSMLKNTGKFLAGIFTGSGIITKKGVFGRIVTGTLRLRGALGKSDYWNRLICPVTNWIAGVKSTLSWTSISKPTTTYADEDKPTTEWEEE